MLLLFALLSTLLQTADQTVCLYTTIGMQCQPGAEQMGSCWNDHETIICYVSNPTSIPLRASYYSPELCAESPINCNGDPENKASRPFHPDQYGRTAACPHDWIFKTIVTPDLEQSHWYCDDRGGAIHLVWRPVFTLSDGTIWTWAWNIDFMLDPAQPLPWWVYTLITNWQLQES